MINLLSAGWFKMDAGDAAVIAILGFSIVVIVIAMLVLFLMCFERLFRLEAFKEKTSSENIEAASESGSEQNEGELIAAITAAVWQCLLEENPQNDVPPFVIKNIKRKIQ